MGRWRRDQIPRIGGGELKELDRVVEDGEKDDDDHVAKTIADTALKCLCLGNIWWINVCVSSYFQIYQMQS